MPADWMDRETPEWTPLCEALDRAAAQWDSDNGGDQFIVAMDAAMEAWRAYKEARFGVTPSKREAQNG